VPRGPRKKALEFAGNADHVTDEDVAVGGGGGYDRAADVRIVSPDLCSMLRHRQPTRRQALY